ncbi:uncharacterized protein LOC133716242 [Rosa rugosa]|uniref:uncharacterized protein LOC133716242 n=1 Tax=Rosa rugosa TaxID=74645 RepID=UPI002B409961|nr:uncharacterized protein LOC133716242 [Rosa rugosa]
MGKNSRSRDEDTEEMMIATVTEESTNQTRRYGSHPDHAPNEERLREERGQNLMPDYLVECLVFKDWEFQTCYRMSLIVFKCISTDLCQYDRYFVQKSDTTGKVGLLSEQKMTTSLRMLAYGDGADQYSEYCWMAKSTSIAALQRFSQGIVNLYSVEYLRVPNAVNLRQLLAKDERRGFPRMIGSINYMHWQWKNCPSGWAAEYSGRKHIPATILEAVASYDTWIWHVFFGMPGACNDLNVLMIVKDERPEDNDDEFESNNEEDNNLRPRIAECIIA